MLVKINTIEGEMVMNIDALDIKIIRNVLKKVKKEWVKKFIIKVKDSRNRIRYKVVGVEKETIYTFDTDYNYESVLGMCTDDDSFYVKMPIELIRKKLLDEGFVCRVNKIYSGYLSI